MQYHAIVREENDGYWAEVQELPGCFASGRDLEELKEAVLEAIRVYQASSKGAADAAESPQLAELVLTS